jgi:hypothetical protein
VEILSFQPFIERGASILHQVAGFEKLPLWSVIVEGN